MKKKLLKNILVVFLLAIAIFAVFQYISLKKQAAILEAKKQSLLEALRKEEDLQQLLAKENSELKENLKTSEEELTKLTGDLSEKQNDIEQLRSQISLLEAKNTALMEEKEKLELELAQVSQENDNLKARLSSPMELKQALRELKRQMRKVSVKIQQRARAEKIAEGNRGFLIKNGHSTYPAKVKIKVIPAP